MQTVSNYALSSCSHFVFTAFPYEDLGARGFTINAGLDFETDGVITQTLLVNSPARASVNLEFRKIVDEEAFAQSLKKEMPPVRGREALRPSLCFYGAEQARLSLGSIPVQVVHQQNTMATAPSHPNTVQSVFGIYLGLDEKGVQEWTLFLGLPPSEGGWELKDGVRIVIAQPGDGIYESMDIRKDFPFWAVMLKCESFAEFNKVAEPERIMQWQGKPAALIKEHLTDWDLLII